MQFESSFSESGCSSLDDDYQGHKLERSLSPCDLAKNRLVADDTISSKPKSNAKVVILGAGLAGLAAAQKLWSSGIEDIILLEAQNYIGGRVKTIKHSNGILELGAQYFHGAKENPIYDWVSDNVLLSGYEDGSILMQGRYFTASGEQLPPKLVARFLELIINIKIALFNKKRNSIVTLVNDENNNNEPSKQDVKKLASCFNRSAEQEFRNAFEEKINSEQYLIDNELKLKSLFEWFLRSEAIENGCDLMNEVSMASYIDWADYDDGGTLDLAWGYQSLLQWFMNQFPTNQIVHLNCQVTNIKLVQNDIKKYQQNTVIVQYRDVNDNSNQGEIECSHVIVTASMGFLKRHLDSLFTPPLPLAKQELIRTIGYGTVNKIFLHFEGTFWLHDDEDREHQQQMDGIKLVWSDADFELNKEFPLWARDITSFEIVKRQPNVLVGWIGGQGAKLMERESDNFIGKTCVRILGKFLLPKNRDESLIGKLIWCMATRWYSNPFTCGSYSFRSMKSQDKNIEILNEPIYLENEKIPATNTSGINDDVSRDQVPVIQFAGEATAGELYSTTHGAIMSGWREADRLIVTIN